LRDFWYDKYTYAKRYAKSDDFEKWKNYRPPHNMKSSYERYLEFFTWKVLGGVHGVGPQTKIKKLMVSLASIPASCFLY